MTEYDEAEILEALKKAFYRKLAQAAAITETQGPSLATEPPDALTGDALLKKRIALNTL